MDPGQSPPKCTRRTNRRSPRRCVLELSRTLSGSGGSRWIFCNSSLATPRLSFQYVRGNRAHIPFGLRGEIDNTEIANQPQYGSARQQAVANCAGSENPPLRRNHRLEVKGARGAIIGNRCRNHGVIHLRAPQSLRGDVLFPDQHDSNRDLPPRVLSTFARPSLHGPKRMPRTHE